MASSAMVAVALALVMVEADQLAEDGRVPPRSWIYTAGPEGARAVLATIAGSMITVAGIVFSATMVALTLASVQFGPIRRYGNEHSTVMVWRLDMIATIAARTRDERRHGCCASTPMPRSGRAGRALPRSGTWRSAGAVPRYEAIAAVLADYSGRLDGRRCG